MINRRTFHGPFEEHLAAPARHHAVVAPRRLVPADQAHFGRRGRLSQRRAVRKRHTDTNQGFETRINRDIVFQRQQQSRGRCLGSAGG